MVKSYEIKVRVPGISLIVPSNLASVVEEGLSEEEHLIWDLRVSQEWEE